MNPVFIIIGIAVVIVIIILGVINQKKQHQKALEDRRKKLDLALKDKFVDSHQYKILSQDLEKVVGLAFLPFDLKMEYYKNLNQRLFQLEKTNTEGFIHENDYVSLKELLEKDAIKFTDFDQRLAKIIETNKRWKYLLSQYGAEIADKIFSNNPWVGMTYDQLIDMKGQPTRVDKEELKTKTKYTLIYGNKNSGDYFVVENNIVVKVVDRDNGF